MRIGERLRLRLINATAAETFWVDTMPVGEEIERIALRPRQFHDIESRALERPATGTTVWFAVG